MKDFYKQMGVAKEDVVGKNGLVISGSLSFRGWLGLQADDLTSADQEVPD